LGLTNRAKSWLSTLSREKTLPTVEVEKILLDGGHTPHQVWLDFHENYGGYIEEVGPGDIAIWGLARGANPATPLLWFKAEQVYIEPARKRFSEAILCADAHPTHGYELGSDGRFFGIGGPAESFVMKLERHGVLHDFHSRGKVRRTLLTHKSDEPEHVALLNDMAPSLVHEASGRAKKLYLEERRLLEFCPFIKQLVMWEQVP